MAIGTEAVAEAEKLCVEVAREFPRAVFFAGKLVFQKERWYQRLLHNETAYPLQRRLQFAGSTRWCCRCGCSRLPDGELAAPPPGERPERVLTPVAGADPDRVVDGEGWWRMGGVRMRGCSSCTMRGTSG